MRLFLGKEIVNVDSFDAQGAALLRNLDSQLEAMFLPPVPKFLSISGASIQGNHRIDCFREGRDREKHTPWPSLMEEVKRDFDMLDINGVYISSTEQPGAVIHFERARYVRNTKSGCKAGATLMTLSVREISFRLPYHCL